MREDGLHPGGFADHAERGAQAGFPQVLDQPPRTVAGGLLVVADEQVHGPRQPTRLELGRGGERRGDEPLHVGGAAGVPSSVLAAQPVNGSEVHA